MRRYQSAEPASPPPERPVVADVAGTMLRDCGGSGPTVVLVPSLINPPTILDLESSRSLAQALTGGNSVLLLDWGAARARAGLDLTGHVEERLRPLLGAVGPAVLVGYCLGGTLALAAAAREPAVRAVATLASPWRFEVYPASARQALTELWRSSRPVAERLGFLPMEVLQAAFWQIDPERIVAKFAHFADLASGSPEARAFVGIEDWANAGEPLPLPAAAQMVEQLFGAGAEGLGPLPDCAMLHVTASDDRIVPAATAAPGPSIAAQAGHVGMVVGRRAGDLLHRPLRTWLEGLAPRG
ncbi:alpha/beta fold hydrolase [Sphingomonas rosea]|uniref:alpha/beta fold hydrolase n=1 Tax=Sphingomonas rosea TaxID=335605 RepID=UPI0031DCDBDF